jgi:hypothetical protein
MQTDKNIADGLDLFPVSIIAFGAPAAPVERLIGIQAAVARCVGWLANLRLPRLRLAPHAAPRLHPTNRGEL